MFKILLFICVACYRVMADSQQVTYNELPCLRANGTCMLTSKCPSEVRLTGHCPTQADRGVECCLSEMITSCKSRGGECMPKEYYCNPHLIYRGSSDCEQDEHCCILV